MSARCKAGRGESGRPVRIVASTSRLRIERPAAKAIRLLLVEDSEDDALLVVRELRRGGYEPSVTRVESSREFRMALEEDPPDIIISDHTIPGYGGLAALVDWKASGKDIPFILVSGTVGEEVAVSAMRAGAHDYVLKGDLTRLPAAVGRELRDRDVRTEQARIHAQRSSGAPRARARAARPQPTPERPTLALGRPPARPRRSARSLRADFHLAQTQPAHEHLRHFAEGHPYVSRRESP